MKATIFDIQHFSIHDGPGIRTTVFFKGCPLRCLWCHNPEGLERRSEISFNAGKCTYCGNCVTLCPNAAHTIKLPDPQNAENTAPVHILDRDKCVACGTCTAKCWSKALEVSGRERELDEIIADVLKDKVFYETSGGGMTISGGEPLAQPDAAIELLRMAKEAGLNTAVETSGYTTEEVIKKAAKYCDLFLLDCKETDPIRHKEYTGVTNEKPLRTLELLNELGAKVVLRCPIIPGLNDREDHYRQIGALADKYEAVTEVNIEPYHPLGVSKSENFGKIPGYNNTKFMDKADAKAIVIPTTKPVKVM